MFAFRSEAVKQEAEEEDPSHRADCLYNTQSNQQLSCGIDAIVESSPFALRPYLKLHTAHFLACVYLYLFYMYACMSVSPPSHCLSEAVAPLFVYIRACTLCR